MFCVIQLPLIDMWWTQIESSNKFNLNDFVSKWVASWGWLELGTAQPQPIPSLCVVSEKYTTGAYQGIV